MNIIKLDATPSTNDFLKALLTKQFVENFTVVTAESQTSGRGQMGAKWETAPGENLTFSVLVKDLLVEVTSVFHLNVAVAVSIIEALEYLNLASLTIKWPNDILAENKKIAGLLIENSFKSSGEIFSVIGIGLNVNQKNFESLPHASSLALLLHEDQDREEILNHILTHLKRNIALMQSANFDLFWDKYSQKLFKKGLPMPFESNLGERFMGIIQGVSKNGKLEVLLEDDSVKQFDIKEIKMLY